MSTKRQPKGIPVGGQYAENAHDEAGSSLSVSGGYEDIDWDQAQDIDDLNDLSPEHRARIATLEDHILSRPHPVSLGDGRTALFWHERANGMSTKDGGSVVREARAILNADGEVTHFEHKTGNDLIDWHADFEPDSEMQDLMNAEPLPSGDVPVPVLSTDDEGRPVRTGNRFKDGASAQEIARGVRSDISDAVDSGLLPKEFSYTTRGTGTDRSGVVSVVIDISEWKHGDNYGLLPGQSVYDHSSELTAKVQRAERVVEAILADHDRVVVLAEDGSETQHAYTSMSRVSA